MKVAELIALLQKVDSRLDVMMTYHAIGIVVGNIEHVGGIEESTYGFFGEQIPCVIIRSVADDIADSE